MKKIKILGVEYTIKGILEKDVKEDDVLSEARGVCDFTNRQIEYLIDEQKEDRFADLSVLQRKTQRHEIIHAALYESGLYHNTPNSWAINEEMVDWFAIQMPKLIEIFDKLGIKD